MSIDELPGAGAGRALSPARAAASIEVPPVQVAPGERTQATVTVTNLTSSPASFVLELSGLEPAWYTLPDRVGPIEPGASATVPIEVCVPRGYPPCSLLASLEARPLESDASKDARDAAREGATDEPRETGRHDLEVVVGDSAAVGVRMEPTEISGHRRGRFSLFVRNRSAEVQQVHVRGVAAAAGVRGRFRPGSALVPPGHETKVAGRVATRLRFFGDTKRHPFAVHVDWRGTPVVAEGTFTSHPLLPSWASKTVVIALVIALWAAVAVVGIQALSNHLHHAAVQRTTLGQPHHHGASSAQTGATSSPAGTKAGGSRSGAPGSKGSTSKTSSGSTVEVAGKVTGRHPGGVTVSLAPTSLIATALTGSPGHGAVLAAAFKARRAHAASPPGPGADALLVRSGARAAPLPDGKVYGTQVMAALFPGLSAAHSPTLTTKTNAGGNFAFSGVVAPGTYLATFTEPGYNTKKFVVQTEKGKSVTLAAVMSPGTGSLSGVVRGPRGPLGGASVTVTDGAITLTTVTPTIGSDVGHWSVSGLNTPDSYSVTASHTGYGTQVTTAKLAPSASIAGVNLKLLPGVASISGTVRAATSSQPLGGVTVSATNGSATAVATTSTVAPIGTYLLPDLSVPGTWTLTISGAGWLTETQRVKLRSNVVVNAELTGVGANVVGVVSSSAGGLANVGLSLKGATTTYKALSASAAPVGGFDFADILPGQYVLSATLFGYTTQSASVKVTSGETATIDLTMPYIGASAVPTGSITGSVVNEFTAAPLATIPIELDGQTTKAITNSAGVYTIANVAPGLHQVTAMGESKTFANGSVQVSVAEGVTVTAPAINLPHLTTIHGTVTSSQTGKVVPTPTVKLLSHGSTVGSPVVITSATNGTYKITHVSPGSYVLQVTKKATKFNLRSVDVTVTAGVTTVTLDVSLTSGATFQATTWMSKNGSLQLTTGVCVILSITKTGTKKTATAQVTASASKDQVTFSDLVAGSTYVVTFKLTKTLMNASGCLSVAAGTVTASETTYTFTAKTDSSTIYSAVLVPLNRSVTVSLRYPYVTATNATSSKTFDCPIRMGSPGGTCPTVLSTAQSTDLPTVTLTGTTGYNAKTGGTPGGAQTGSITLKYTTSHPGEWVPKSTAPVKFVDTQVSVKVTTSQGQFAGVTKSMTLKSTGTTTLSVLLTPTPVAVSGTITPTSGVSISVVPGTLTPTSTSSTTANNLGSRDTVTATEGASGAITWADTATGFPSGHAQPGVYTLAFSKTGFKTSSGHTVTIGVCPPGTTGGSCSATLTGSPFTLRSNITLTVTPSNVPATLTAPTVTLYKGSTKITSKTLSSGVATFTQALTPTGTTYNYTVTGQAIKKFTSLDLTMPASPTTTLAETPALTALGWLTGKVMGVLVPTNSSASGAKEILPGTKVTAAATSTGTANKCPTLSATTNSTGIYKIVATTKGLCPGKTYTLTLARTGFKLGTTTVAITTGTKYTKTLTPDATKITQTLTVSGVASGVTLTARATSSIGPARSCTFKVGTAAAKTCTTETAKETPTTAAKTVFTFTISPTSYSYGLSAYQYEPVTIGPLSYTPGSTPTPQSYGMTQQLVKIFGTVKASATGGSSGAKAIATLVLDLKTSSGTSVKYTATTNATGTYVFKTVIPGNYQIVPTDNYLTLSTVTISTGTQTTVHQTVTVYAHGRMVDVAVNGTLANLPSGAKVRLTPTSGSVPAKCGTGASTPKLLVAGFGKTYTATPAASTSFSTVIPDFYKVSVGGSTTHPAAFTLLVCPTATSSAKTTPAAPAVTIPTVAPTPTTLSVTYGAETSGAFTIAVSGPTTHGHPKGTVKLTAGGTSSTPTCTTPPTYTTHSHTDVTTFTCHLSAIEFGAGTHSSVKAVFVPTATASSDATSPAYYYVTATSTTTITITVAQTKATPTFTVTTPTVTITYGTEETNAFTVHVIGTTGHGYPIAKTTVVTLNLTSTPAGTSKTKSCTKLSASTVTSTFTCTLTATLLAAGKWKVTATYTPASPTSSSSSNYGYRAKTSSTKTFTVNKKYLTPTVTIAASTLTYGSEHTGTFTITVTGTATDGYPKGKVTVNTSSTPPKLLCTSSTPKPTPTPAVASTHVAIFKCHLAIATDKKLTAGTYSGIKATYTGPTASSSNSNYAYNGKTSTPAVDLTVNPESATTASVTLTAPSLTYGSEATGTFTATVTGQATKGHPQGTVTVKKSTTTTLCASSTPSSTPAGTPPTSVFTCHLASNTQLAAGTYSGVKATYTAATTGTNYAYGNKLSTTSVTLTVAPEPVTTTSVVLTLSHSTVAHTAEATETFTVVVTGTTTHGPPKGTVALSGATGACTPTKTATTTSTTTFACTLANTAIGAGTYSLVATYTPGSPSTNSTNYVYTSKASSAQTLKVT